MQSLPIFEFLVAVLVATTAFFIPFSKLKTKGKAIAATSIALTLLLFISDRVVWANTGFNLIEHATCQASPSVHACKDYGLAGVVTEPRSQIGASESSMYLDEPALDQSSSRDGVDAQPSGTAYSGYFSDPMQRLGTFSGDLRESLTGSWSRVAYYEFTNERWRLIDGASCAQPSITYSIRDTYLVQRWPVLDSHEEHQYKIAAFEGDTIVLNKPEQRIIFISSTEMMYEDEHLFRVRSYYKKCL